MSLKEILKEAMTMIFYRIQEKYTKLDYHTKMSDWFPSRIANQKLAPIHIIDKMKNTKYKEK